VPGLDSFIVEFDRALRAVSGVLTASRQSPAESIPEADLDSRSREHAAALMRVNHVGEVCAQGLYDAQGRFSKDIATKRQFERAAREEQDHLAWTAQRLHELNSRPSLLNPLWYAGSYALGTIAACMGDPKSLGFVVETERQVEAHLAGHLHKLPVQDAKSRAIVEQMRLDELAHGDAAQSLGADEMPKPVRKAMQAMAKMMTTTAYYL